MGRKDPEATVSGMPRGTANSKLRKKLLFELLRTIGANKCRRCGLDIVLSEDLAIEHLTDWKDDQDLFWMLENIAFSHLSCSSGAARQEGKPMLADISIIGEDGEQLPTFLHDGKHYVAGRKDERYDIHVQNKIGERIEVVITVDGRDVISGEKGDASRNGYAIGPYGIATIKGFRQSDERVAAFRFATKDESYSSKMGTPQNVGVIGVAVYREKQETWKPPLCIPIPYPVPYPVPQPYPSVHWWNTTTGNTIRTNGTLGINSTFSHDSIRSDTTCSTNSCVPTPSAAAASAVDDDDAERSVAPPTKGVECFDGAGAIRPRRIKSRQRLGTEYGESIRDSITRTRFIRASQRPDEVWQILYDTMSALRKKGIPTHKWRKQDRPTGPDPFPASPYIAPGYAKPPPR